MFTVGRGIWSPVRFSVELSLRSAPTFFPESFSKLILEFASRSTPTEETRSGSTELIWTHPGLFLGLIPALSVGLTVVQVTPPNSSQMQSLHPSLNRPTWYRFPTWEHPVVQFTSWQSTAPSTFTGSVETNIALHSHLFLTNIETKIGKHWARYCTCTCLSRRLPDLPKKYLQPRTPFLRTGK